MTIQQALLSAIKKLRQHNKFSAHLDAEVLLADSIHQPKSYLIAHPQKKLTEKQKQRFVSQIRTRTKGVPVAYLTGRKEFYGLSFYVNNKVLVPRPETETLIEQAITSVRELQATLQTDTVTIADIGTGTGCIGIVLAKYLPGVKIIATDISKSALSIAKKNVQKYKVTKKIRLVHGDLLAPWRQKKNRLPIPTLIIANLPYLTKNELQNVPHEPPEALYGGKLGMALIEKLISQSPNLLPPNGRLLLEISPTQVDAVQYLVEQHLPQKSVFFIKDLGQLDRVAVIQ